jgi:hypothetical protein
MASYRLTVGAVTSGGSAMQANPVDAAYGAPYVSVNKVMMDSARGGTAWSNLDGTEWRYPSGAEFRAGAGELAQSAYIGLAARGEASTPAVKSANDRALRSRYFGVPTGFVAYELMGANNTSADLSVVGRGDLEIRYVDANGTVAIDGGSVNEKELNIYWLNETAGRWEAVGVPVIDTNANTVTVKAGRYGIYAILADRTPVGFDESFVVYPNPFDPTTEVARVRVRLAQPGVVSAWVYTLVGERVAQAADRLAVPAGVTEDAITWDGRNGRGVVVVNGTYIIKAEIEYADGTKESKIWKVAVVK